MNKTTNKTFNWENYTVGREEHKFEDLTFEELQEWAYYFEYTIEKTKKGIYVRGKNGSRMKWK